MPSTITYLFLSIAVLIKWARNNTNFCVLFLVWKVRLKITLFRANITRKKLLCLCYVVEKRRKRSSEGFLRFWLDFPEKKGRLTALDTVIISHFLKWFFFFFSFIFCQHKTSFQGFCFTFSHTYMELMKLWLYLIPLFCHQQRNNLWMWIDSKLC